MATDCGEIFYRAFEGAPDWHSKWDGFIWVWGEDEQHPILSEIDPVCKFTWEGIKFTDSFIDFSNDITHADPVVEEEKVDFMAAVRSMCKK